MSLQKIVSITCLTFNLFVITWTQLTSSSVSEGPCMPDIHRHLATNVNPIWIAIPKTYYVPIASEGCYRSYTEALLGRPAESKKELAQLKLQIVLVTPFPTPIFITYGFRNRSRLTQACPLSGISQVYCVPIVGSKGTDFSSLRTSANSIIYTDNETTMLVVRCRNGSVRDYEVLTVDPDVGPKTREIINEKIREMGFNETLMSYQYYLER